MDEESSRKADIVALRDAFPSADDSILLDALKKHGKSFTAAYWFLSGKHASAWGHASIAPRGTVGIMDIDSDSDEEFVSATQSHFGVEDRWWDTFAQTRSFKIQDLPAASLWTPVCCVSMARTFLSPRVLGQIRGLGLLLKSPPDFQRSLDSLKSFPSYRRLDDLHTSRRSESHNIITCLTLLLSEGVLAASTATWLAKRIMQDPRSTRASSALAMEAEHQDMQSMLQTTLDDFALEAPAPPPPPHPGKRPKASVVPAATSSDARVLRNAKRKADSEASSAVAAALEADAIAK